MVWGWWLEAGRTQNLQCPSSLVINTFAATSREGDKQRNTRRFLPRLAEQYLISFLLSGHPALPAILLHPLPVTPHLPSAFLSHLILHSHTQSTNPLPASPQSSQATHSPGKHTFTLPVRHLPKEPLHDTPSHSLTLQSNSSS